MSERMRKAIKALLGGVRYITLAPPPRRSYPIRRRRDPGRYWAKAGERLSRAAVEVGRVVAQ